MHEAKDQPRSRSRRRGGLFALSVVLGASALCACLAPPAWSLSPEGIEVMEGEIVYQPFDDGPPFSVIRMRLRNSGDLPLEGLRLLVSFSSLPLAGVVADTARQRDIELAPPLEPGEEREVTFTERQTKLHSAVKVAEVFPAFQMLVDGKRVELDPPAFMWDGALYGPVADLARTMGWTVEWDEGWRLATIVSREHAVLVQVGSGYAIADGALLDIGTGVRGAEGKAIAPLRPLLEALGAIVRHDADRNMVEISTPGGAGQQDTTASEWSTP